MTIDANKNERITVTLPREVLDQLRELAQQLTDGGIGKVNLSDLLREGAKKILKDAPKPLD